MSGALSLSACAISESDVVPSDFSGGTSSGNGTGTGPVVPGSGGGGGAEIPNPGSSGGAANGGAGSSSSGGTPDPQGTGGAETGVCEDLYPFDDGYGCAQQVAWGKCSEDWMAGACDLSCGRCSGGGGDDGGTSSCGLSPADPAATSKTEKLLCYLKTHSYISGQTDEADAIRVEEMTGRYPAIVAFDFYRYTDGDTSETQKAIDWANNKKGIVAFQWHWKSPAGGEFYANYSFENDLGNTGSKLYQDIDTVATELKKMGDAGVTVLYRPLHEANNNFMWWAKRGADNYKKLWHLIFERTMAKGAHNLIWVFNGMARDQSTPLSDWYPGDEVVDVISSDYFQSHEDFTMMQNIGSAKNKVVAIAETFNQLDPAKDAAYSYGIVWASRDWGGKGAEGSWQTAMANPKTISIDQLPDMSAW